jgi:uncharacterized membrane protein (DUF2068 family)
VLPSGAETANARGCANTTSSANTSESSRESEALRAERAVRPNVAVTSQSKHISKDRANDLAPCPEPSTLLAMPKDSRRGLMLIGIFKLLKALGLVVLSAGAFSLVHRDVEETVRHWLEFVRVDSHARLVDHVLEKVGGVSPKTLRRLGVGTLAYAAVFATEGVGLILAKPWAEYMTTLVTLSFLPIEAYELAHHPSIAKGVVIVINIAVVVYLVLEIRRRRAREAPVPEAAPAEAAASKS